MENINKNQEKKGKSRTLFDKFKDPETRLVYTYGPLTNFAHNLLPVFMQSVTSIFLTDVAKVGVIMAGNLQYLQSFLKIASGPITGGIFDKTPFKKGNYYPWLQWIPALAAIISVFMFLTPSLTTSTSLMTAMLLIAMLAQSTFQNMQLTVTNCIYPMVTSDPKERVTASTLANIFKEAGKAVCGLIFPIMLIFFAKGGKSEANSYFMTAAIIGVLTFIGFYLASLEVKKSHIEQGAKLKVKEKVSFGEMMKGLFTNTPLLILFFMMMMFVIRSMGLLPIAPYFFKYVAESPASMAVFMSMNGLVAIVFMFFAPIWIKIFKEQKRALIVALLCGGLCHFLIGWTAWGKTVLGVSILMSLGTGFVNIVSIINLNLFAACSDYAEWKGGKSMPGLSMSIYAMAIQLSVLFSAIIRTFALNKIGFVANVAPTPAVQQGILWIISYSFGIALIAAAVIAFFFPLNDGKVIQIRQEIDERRLETI